MEKGVITKYHIKQICRLICVIIIVTCSCITYITEDIYGDTPLLSFFLRFVWSAICIYAEIKQKNREKGQAKDTQTQQQNNSSWGVLFFVWFILAIRSILTNILNVIKAYKVSTATLSPLVSILEIFSTVFIGLLIWDRPQKRRGFHEKSN